MVCKVMIRSCHTVTDEEDKQIVCLVTITYAFDPQVDHFNQSAGEKALNMLLC